MGAVLVVERERLDEALRKLAFLEGVFRTRNLMLPFKP